MSAVLRRIGIFVYLLATIALYGIGHPYVFWLCLALAVGYLMLCGHVERHLVKAALKRHEQIRDNAVKMGRSQEDLDKFNRLPHRVAAQDFQSVPATLRYATHVLFAAGILLLCAALRFRFFP
ncbi:hypothetical protein Pcar_2699 [Syntrophotalea carbinolica DSM 2380]|uniref:Uncharacterized protein n=1 Tax=Syntrophotalea carbinolica (strain DSM 2380 / NBRC 103641 / GraBd1) TaxID=338963 RepID=Q3A122_SYNC1|nr:hypothetical protein [Syntrophotalea carbinolica]ABA89935.1 hypothetical protein Pcar_2699 [Syntrophotalea carbinolica DSM 2380]